MTPGPDHGNAPQRHVPAYICLKKFTWPLICSNLGTICDSNCGVFSFADLGYPWRWRCTYLGRITFDDRDVSTIGLAITRQDMQTRIFNAGLCHVMGHIRYGPDYSTLI
jgi:hypothetical protein